MKRLLLKLYDFLSGRRVAAVCLLSVLLLMCAFSARRMHYEEDISAFLPSDELGDRYSKVYSELGGQDKIAFFFRGEDPAEVKNAMTSFDGVWKEEDADGLVPDAASAVAGGSVGGVYDFVCRNIPYFLKEEDYARMDSLLAVPSYCESRLDAVKEAMYLPSAGFSSRYFRLDPLDLFSPVFARLKNMNPSGAGRIEDGLLFAADGTGVVFIESPFGSSESGMNAGLSDIADRVCARLSAGHPGVEVFATGGPLVAAGNARRIRQDSFTALGIALLLICLLLFLSYRRLSDVFFIVLSIACGAVFSLGILSIFKTSVSVIVLGIGSLILGIAVNYPLHYIDHIKYRPDRRQALAEQVNPLLTGNITTVGAFLALLALKSEALRDFGFIGAVMLVGTIVFVLVFLPVLFPLPKRRRTTISLDFAPHVNLPKPLKLAAAAVFVAATLFFLFSGNSGSFDSDLHNINYMTPGQSEGFSILEGLAGRGGDTQQLFVVLEGDDADALLARNEQLGRTLAGCPGTYRSISDFLPSSSCQHEALERWEHFRNAYSPLFAGLREISLEKGFSAKAFSPFYELLENCPEVRDVSYFEPLLNTLGATMYIDKGAGITLVNYLDLPSSVAEEVKTDIREKLPASGLCFSSSDVGGRLVALLSEDFDRIGVMCSLLVLVLLCFSFGSLELGLAAFIPLAVSWVWILGIMGLAGWKFNIVNIILASFIFGQGDDYSIFITDGLVYEYASGKKILHSFRNSVTLSALLMFISIGALITARHPAMRSLAELTMLGMVTVVVMACFLPPLVFRFLTGSRGREREVPVTLGRMLKTGWILLVFLAAMLVFSLAAFLYFLPGKAGDRRKELYHKAICLVSRASLKVIPGVSYRLMNPVGEDFSRPAMYVCNHQSHLDVLALLALNPKLVLLTNDWVWNNPFYGFLIRKADFYPVSDGLDKNVPRLRKLVEKGYSVAVFPEGTRSADCSILRFHRGFAVLARELGLDILPVYIHGFGYALPKKELMLRSAGMSAELGARIPCGSILADAQAFARELRKMYVAEYARIRSERETAAYLSAFVRYQYLYKGREACAECRRVLSATTVAAMADIPADCRRVRVEGSGYGAYALLLALSRPGIKVDAYEPDPDKLAVAAHCSAVPSNLEYHADLAPDFLEESCISVNLRG